MTLRIIATPDERERQQWRGKVRVFEQRNALGEVRYIGEYKRRWYSEWCAVMVPENEDKYPEWCRAVQYFPVFTEARNAAQLEWNRVTAEHAEATAKRFGRWIKVWP